MQPARGGLSAWGLLKRLCKDSCHHFSMCGWCAGEQGTLWHVWHMLWQVSHAILYWDWRTLRPAHWASLQALKHCKVCTGTEHLGIQSCRDALCRGWQVAEIGTCEGGLRMQLICEALSYDAEPLCCSQGCLLPFVPPGVAHNLPLGSRVCEGRSGPCLLRLHRKTC